MSPADRSAGVDAHSTKLEGLVSLVHELEAEARRPGARTRVTRRPEASSGQDEVEADPESPSTESDESSSGSGSPPEAGAA